MLQIEALHIAEKINIAEYLSTKYKANQFVNFVKSHESNQPNMKSTIKIAAKVIEELNQSNEKKRQKRKTYNTQKQGYEST
jgi:hypothetical protein